MSIRHPEPHSTPELRSVPVPGLLDRLARRLVLARLRRLRHGRVSLLEPGTPASVRHFGRLDPSEPVQATLTIHDPACFAKIALGGSIGAGEAYMAGDWTCDDLTRLIRILVRNRDVLDGMEEGLARMIAPAQKLLHTCRRNTKDGSRRNIMDHYDVGNDFFSIVLDESLMYSCAFFEREDSSLLDASLAKNDRICRKLHLTPNDHVLEIGTGWGGFALHAAQRFGARVTTTTISRQQYDLAVERIHRAGLSSRITILMLDYRDLPALNQRFDKLVSIEMIEAVGHAYYETFFRNCCDLLEDDGQMLLQAITIEDHRYEQAKRSVDFIQRHMFPGSCIPSVAALCAAMAGATDFRLLDLEDIGRHYPPTLRGWRARLQANWARLNDLGYSDEFLRKWEFYLCYCEGGFLEGSISDVQMLLTKPRVRRKLGGPGRPGVDLW